MNVLWLVVLLALVPLIGCRGPGTESPSQPQPTIMLKELRYFKDGGTTGIVLQNSNGKEVRFCFDGRLKSKTPTRIYANATHPDDAKAELVGSSSDHENELIGMLQSYLDSKYSRAKQAELLAKGSWKLPKAEADASRILRAAQLRRARGLATQYRRNPDLHTARLLGDLLSFGGLPRDQGNQVLLALVEPIVLTRESYAVGKPIHVSIRGRRPFSVQLYNHGHRQYIAPFWEGKGLGAGGGSGPHPAIGGSPRTLRISRGVDTPGEYSAEIRQVFKLFPLHGKTERESLHRPKGPWPISLPPSLVVRNGTFDMQDESRYEVDITIPVKIRVVNPADAEKVEVVSSPALDAAMNAAFVRDTRSSCESGSRSKGVRIVVPFAFECADLPENVAYRFSWRTSDGQTIPVKDYDVVMRKGESWSISLPLLDLLKTHPVGKHAATLILTPDPEAAYRVPEIKTIWGGTLQIPVEFEIIKPQDLRRSK